MAEELEAVYRRIADGSGRQYDMLFSLQSVVTSLIDFDPVTNETLPATVDGVLAALFRMDIKRNVWWNDRLQNIIDFAAPAVRFLIDSLHEKNLREHRISRPEQVREVDSRSMMWLAKKPGFTVKQKIASEQRMMGVYHTTSLDTAENRLFKSFMKKLDGLLLEKENACKKRGASIPSDTERFISLVHGWLKSDECDLISAWNNTPPNNTLLNDRNYRKIWKAHLALQILTEQVHDDIARISDIQRTVLLLLAASRLNGNPKIRFRQTVLFPDYGKLSPMENEQSFLGVAFCRNIWEKFSVSLTEKGISLTCGKNQKEYALPKTETLADIADFAEKACADFFPNEGFSSGNSKNLSDDGLSLASVAAVDLNSVLPSFYASDGRHGRFTKKLLHQQIAFSQGKNSQNGKSEWFSCSGADSKLIFTRPENIRTFSVHSVFDCALLQKSDGEEEKPLSEKACADFAKIIKEELRCQKCLYVASDDADDFSPTVNAFKHSMNSSFAKTEILPRSIAALFTNFDELIGQAKDGDEITVRSEYDGYEIESKIRLMLDRELLKKNPGTKGFKFQRLSFRRTEKESVPKSVPKNLDLILSEGDAALLAGSFSADDFHFEKKPAQKRKAVSLKNSVLHISDAADTSEGALRYDRLQQISPEIPLWCDILPRLAMVDSTGKEYTLVDPKLMMEKKIFIHPAAGKPVRIPISWHFSFPANKPFYEFPLSQGENAQRGKYFAFIKDSAFPLESETECRLHLTYTYGEAIPYRLEFIPLTDRAGFQSVSVKWNNTESPKDLVHIPGPAYVQEDSWETVSALKIKGEPQISVFNSVIEKITSVAENGWNTWKIVDYVGSRHNPIENANVFFLNKVSNGQNCVCYRADFPKNYPVRIGSEISCSFIPSINPDGTPRYDRNGNRGLQAYDLAPKGQELSKSKYFYLTLPVSNMWNQGRSTSDPDFPREFFEKTQKISVAAVKLLKAPQTPKSTRDEACGQLAAFHQDSPPELNEYLDEIISNTLTGDRDEQKSLFHHKRLINAFGYAVGNVKLQWQRDLFEKEVALFDGRDEEIHNFGIEILGIALWRTRNCVTALTGSHVKKIAPIVVNTIKNFLKFNEKRIIPTMKNPVKLDDDRTLSIQMWLKRRLFLRAIELLIALYRVRETSDDDSLLKLVAPIPENAWISELKKMFSSMENFCKTDKENMKKCREVCKNKDAYKPLVSRIHFEIQDEERDNSLPDYLYVLEKFTNGEDCNIKILKIEDEE